MRSLLTFIFCLFTVSAFGQAGIVRQSLTTNNADFSSPAAGQVPMIHSVTAGRITWTNVTSSSGLAVQGFTTNQFLTNYVIANPYSFQDVTQKIVTAIPGQWVLIPPGPDMLHIPTNQISLMRGVNIECWPTFVIGCSNDLVQRPTFSDRLVGATTNVFIFHGGIIISNNANNQEFPIDIRTNGTYLSLRHERQFHYAPSTQARPLVYMENGTFVCRGQRWDNNVYDGIWTEGAGVNYSVVLDEAEVADTLVENGTEITTGSGYVWVGKASKKVPGTAAGAAFTYLKGKSTLLIEDLDVGRGTVFVDGTAATNRSVFQAKRFRNNPSGGAWMMEVRGYSRIQGTEIFAGNQNPIAIETPNSVWENTRINGGGSTNSLEAVVADPSQATSITVEGTLYADKPPTHEIAVSGTMLSPIGLYTNSFAGANVFVNLNGFSRQALVVSNSVTLVWTNAANPLTADSVNAGLSGKQVMLMLFNDKATNMPIAHSTVRTRFLGQVPTTIAPGEHLPLLATFVGTNIVIQSFPMMVQNGSTALTNLVTDYATGTLPGNRVTTNSSSVAGVVKPGVADKVWKTDGSGVPDWRDDLTGAGGGDAALVNSTAITDSFSLSNTTASATVAGTTWSVAAGTDPDPDKITLALSTATASIAGILAAADFATFNSKASTNAPGSTPNMFYKHANGGYAAASGINVETNSANTVSNLNVTGSGNFWGINASNNLTVLAGASATFQNGMAVNNAVATFNAGATVTSTFTANNGAIHGGPVHYTMASISASDIDWGLSSARSKTLTANTTFTFSNLADDRHVYVQLTEDSTGTRTVTWPTATWLGHTNQSGTLTAGGINTNANFITVFHFWRVSGTVYGEVVSTAPSRFDVEWSSGTVPSSDISSRLSDETGSGPAVFANGPALGTFGSSTNANLNFVYVTNNNAFVLTTQLVATNSTVNSNLTMNVNLGVLDLYITNNISITNFSNLEAATSKTVTWHIYPTLVNRTVVWPNLGTPGHAVYWRTNANSPMWTTLTNGNMYVLSMEWRNTNCWASISEWK